MKTIVSGLTALRDEAKVLELRVELLRQIITITEAIQSLQQEHQRQLDLYLETKKKLEEAESKLAKRNDGLELHAVAEVGFVYAKPSLDRAYSPP